MDSLSKDLKIIRSDAGKIFRDSLVAVEPCKAIKKFIHLKGNRLLIGRKERPKAELDITKFDRILLVGAGKAAVPMARGIEDLFGKRIRKGLINVKYGFTGKLEFTEIVEAGHPVPDQNGVLGTGKILDILNGASEKDLIFALISGGGSALMIQPAGEITLADKQAVTRNLLACGADIKEINTVRKHISSSKGGQMANVAFPATVINLMLSDVVGDHMDVIASGPFVPDTSCFGDVWKIFKKYDLKMIPTAVRNHIKAGMDGRIPETPKPNNKIFTRVFTCIVGDNISALEAAGVTARKLGYGTLILSSLMEGEAKELARVHTAIAMEIVKTGRPIPPPSCIISGGETTVTIRGGGLGGRNQEFCLAAALDIAGIQDRVVVLSCGTDGNDGPTDAAGALVDPFTVARGKKVGISAEKFLGDNDAYHFLQKTQDLIITGPTNTNVMDVRLVLVG